MSTANLSEINLKEKDTIRSNNLAHFFSPNQLKQNIGEIDLRAFYYFLKRRKKIIAGSTLFTVVLATVFVFLQAPLFTGEAILQFNSRKEQVVDIKSVLMNMPADEAAINSELDIIKSRYLVNRVFERYKLGANAQFNKEFSGKNGISALIPNSVKSIFVDANDNIAEKEHAIAIDNILKNLSVVRSPRSYSVNLKFSSRSPEFAAQMANAIAEEYLHNQLDIKFSATKRANEWLKARVDELQAKLTQSEQAVNKYKEENNISKLSGATVNDQQIFELNKQLTLAKAEQMQAEAKLKQSDDLKSSARGVESTPKVVESQLIQRLREQETGILRKQSEIKSRYGERHPEVIKVNSELRDLRKKIDSEIDKIIQVLKHDVDSAKIKVKSLEDGLSDLQNKKYKLDRADVQLSELSRQMETDRALYESFLARFKETSNQDLAQTDVNIINKAEVPTEPSWPPKKIIIISSLFLGIGLGILISFIIERLDNGFRSTEQVEEMLGIHAIGLIPELSKNENVANYVALNPTSFYAESLRTVMASVHFANTDKTAKTIMVTSSVPSEGKTSFSISLARLTAASGAKTLLVDCDMRRPAVSKAFNNMPEKGLGDFLIGKADIREIIMKDDISGLHYIKSRPDTAYSQELLASKQMHDFIKTVSLTYDTIILDSPPVMALSDALMLSEIVDTSIFLIQWEKTVRNLAKNALKKLASTGVHISGVVLSRVDLKKQEQYYFGDYGSYYGKYKEYYSKTS